MKSIGDTIKEGRVKKKISRDALGKQTKIKKEFLIKLEESDWEKLPEYPVVTGFVKKIASSLNLNEKHMVALLRRDYPPKILPINPKPDIEEKFTWSPRQTFITGIVIAVLVIAAYLTFQYLNFIKPPRLLVNSPVEGQVVTQNKVVVEGKTDSEASVVINNQPILIDEDGNFSADVEIFEGTKEIVIIAKSRAGKETVVRRKIVPELSDQQ